MKNIKNTACIKFVLFFGLFAMTLGVQAAQVSRSITLNVIDPNHTTEFRSSILKAEKSCADLNCPASPVQVKPLTADENHMISPELYMLMTQTCEQIAETEWPETILDGPYVASFHIDIANIQAVFKGDLQIGYRVTYKDQAWDTEQCVYDPRKPESLQSCEVGSLVESVFFSLTASDFFSDPNGYPQFVQVTN